MTHTPDFGAESWRQKPALIFRTRSHLVQKIGAEIKMDDTKIDDDALIFQYLYRSNSL